MQPHAVHTCDSLPLNTPTTQLFAMLMQALTIFMQPFDKLSFMRPTHRMLLYCLYCLWIMRLFKEFDTKGLEKGKN